MSLVLSVHRSHLFFRLAMSFDLYAKHGSNRTLSLVNPKKPYYQWRLRVPSGHVVRLVVLNLHGAAPGSCTAHKLSAYDFLLPLQNKIIARLATLPGVSSPPEVMSRPQSQPFLHVVIPAVFARLRWCGLPVLGPSPVMKLTSSGNVMLVTFSFSRQRDGAVFKAFFQAIPKAGFRAPTDRNTHRFVPVPQVVSHVFTLRLESVLPWCFVCMFDTNLC